MLTTNLEPVYGIILAYFIIGGKKKMSFSFYVGAVIIIITNFKWDYQTQGR
jgi:hypothetical protein